MKLYVGNLSYSTTQESLETAFSDHGRVEEVAIVMDRETGRPRGFAFVTMNNEDEARAAIDSVNGQEIDGRTVTVNDNGFNPTWNKVCSSLHNTCLLLLSLRSGMCDTICDICYVCVFVIVLADDAFHGDET